MIGYSISFFPGSSGRFLANIVYCLVNDIEEDIRFDNVNSSHETTLFKCNIDFSSIPAIDDHQSKSNYIQLFRHLNFLDSDYVPVLPTHSYPVTEDLDSNPFKNTFKMIVIGLKKNDLMEVNTNHIIKNIWPLLDKLKKHGFAGLSEVDKAYLDHTIKSMADLKINLLKLERSEVIEQYSSAASQMQLDQSYIRFIDPVIDPRYIANTLVIQYNDLFIETSTGFKGLDILSKWLNVLPSQHIIEVYKKYVEGRNLIHKRFEHLSRRVTYENR